MIGEIVSESHLWLLLLLQGTACVGLGLAGSYALRRRAARTHQILLIGVVASLVMPALYVSVQHFELGILTSKAPVTSEPQEFVATAPLSDVAPPIPVAAAVEHKPLVVEATAPVVPASPPVEETTAVRVPWSMVLLVGWIVVSVLLLGRLLLRFLLGLRLLAGTEPVEAPSLLEALENARARFGLSTALEIRRSAQVRSPIIWCWRKPPVLLVQRDIAKASETSDLAGVFCHELAHWKRLDHLSGLFAELMVCVLPWHPLLWWAKSRLLKLSEEVCDDWVLASGQAGVDYAESLLDLSPQREMAFVPTVVGKEKAMKERIRRIVREQCGNPRIGTRWALTVSILALVCTVGVAFAQRRPVERDWRERAERGELRERREGDEDRRELVVAGRRNVLERMLEQLVAQTRETEAVLRKQGDELGARGHVLRSELDALRDHIQIVERQLHNLQRAEPGREDPDTPRERTPRVEEIEAHAKESMRHREELDTKAHLMELELEELGDARPEVRDKLMEELREIHERMKSLDREHANLGGRRARERTEMARERAIEAREKAERARELTERLRDLQAHGSDMKRRLQRMDNHDSEEAQELRANLDKVHEELRMVQKRQRADRPPVLRSRRTSRNGLNREEQLRRTHRGLTAQIRLTEEKLKSAEEQDGPAADRLRRVLEQLHQRRESLERETSPLRDTRRERPGIEVEVEELRDKVNGMHEEMTQMRRLLEQLLERSQNRVELEEVEEIHTVR